MRTMSLRTTRDSQIPGGREAGTDTGRERVAG